MSRGMSLAILVLVVGAVVVVPRLADGPEQDRGCQDVRATLEVVETTEAGRELPTTALYEQAADAVEEAALQAPPTVSAPLAGLTEAYRELADQLEGFDPADETTYTIVEQNTAAIEAGELRVEARIVELRAWLDSRCG